LKNGIKNSSVLEEHLFFENDNTKVQPSKWNEILKTRNELTI